MFGSVPGHFANLRHVKRCKTSVSGLNALFRGTHVAKMVSQQKDSFYTIRPKMMFGSVSEHFTNLRRVKWCKTCVWSLNALFRGSEGAIMVSQQKHPFYTIRPKMMFGSVPEHFANIQNINDAKLVFHSWMRYFKAPKLWNWFCNKIFCSIR